MMHLRLGKGPDEPLSVLCLGAHSDDIEIGCGATVLRLARQFQKLAVRWVVFAADERREGEARRSADVFLAEAAERRVDVHRFRNGYFPDAWASIKDRFEALKQDEEPDLILTHWGKDAHQDHRVLSELAWNTWRDHFVLEYEIPKYDGDLGHPGFFVAVDGATAERKIDLILRCFESQRDRPWFTRETFLGLMRLRAVEVQCPQPYAEGFHCRKCLL